MAISRRRLREARSDSISASSELLSDPYVTNFFGGPVRIFDNTVPCCNRPAIPGNRLDLYRNAAGNSIIDPVGTNIINSPFPAPNRDGVFHNFRTTTGAPATTNYYVQKLDFNLSDKHCLSFSSSYRKLNSIKGFPRFPEPWVAQGVWRQEFRSQYYRLQEDFTIRPNLLNHFNAGFSRSFVQNRNFTRGMDPRTLGLPGNAPQNLGLPFYALLSTVYEKTGHIERAIPAMRLAIEREPQSEQRRFEYGMLLTNAMAPAAAVIRLEESLRLFPNSSRLWFALGIASFKQDQNEEAAQAFARAFELDLKFAAPLVYLGLTRVEKGQYEEAVKLYEQALAINDALGVVDYLIANALTKESSPDNAKVEAHLLRAIRLEPNFAPARLSLAKLRLRANRLDEARTELERVIALDADLAEAHYQLGLV